MRKKVEHIVFDRPWYRPIVFGIVVVGMDYVLFFLFRYIDHGWAESYRNSRFILDGLLVGGLASYMGKAHRRRIKRRLKELAYLNHHVRNAVQVMMGVQYLPDEQRRNQMVRDACQQIIDCVKKISEEEGVALGGLKDFSIVPHARGRANKI